MFVLVVLCFLTGIVPGLMIDLLAPVAQSLVGEHMPVQTALPWLSIVPIAESRSSYNGALVFAFIAVSASFAVYVVHRFGSHALPQKFQWIGKHDQRKGQATFILTLAV